VLAAREAELDAVPKDLAALTNYNERCPDLNLLVQQLASSVDTSRVSRARGEELRRESISLYAALGSRDAVESIIHRHLVLAHNAAAGCYGRLATTSDPRARHINMCDAIKATNAICGLIKLRDARRGEGQEQLSVGRVNIEAGGQAIVGKVEVVNRPEAPSQPTPKPTGAPMSSRT
jgi:hypothetical protein